MRAPRKTLRVRRAVWLLVGGLLSGCGGGGVASGPVPLAATPTQNTPGQQVPPASNAMTLATFEIIIPQAAPAVTTQSIRPLYVSPNTASVSIAVDANPATTFTISPTSCTGTPQKCSFSLPATIGAHLFTINTYDASNNLLSTGKITKSIASGHANTIVITLSGVVATLAISEAGPPPIGSTSSTPLTVTAYDASFPAATIVGAYLNPVNLSTNDPTDVKLSTTKLTNSSQIVSYTYDGVALLSGTFSIFGSVTTPSPTLQNSLVVTPFEPPPTNVTTAISGSNVQVTWSAGPAVKSFAIYRGNSPLTLTQIASVGPALLGITVNYLDSSPPGGIEYYLITQTATNGQISQPSPVVSVLVSANTWQTVASMPTARFDLAAATSGNVLYAIGGQTNISPYYSNTVEAFDPAANAWTTKALMPTPRFGLGITEINHVIYAVGGYNRSSLNTLEAYTTSTDTWVTMAPMLAPRYILGVASANGILYAVGGYAGGYTGTLEAYNPITNLWVTKASMPTARGELCVAVVNGILYAIGGVGRLGVAVNTVEAYDPAADAWSTKSPYPTVIADAAATVLNGKIYLFGGYTSSGVTNAVEAYDPSTNSWNLEAPMPTSRTFLAGGVINGVGYAVGGDIQQNGTDTALNTVEAYTP